MSSSTFFRMTLPLYEQLQGVLLEDNDEKHAFVMGYGVRSGDRYVVTCKEIVTFRREEIEVSPVHVRIGNDLVNGIFRSFVNSDFNVLTSCHSHPFEKGDVWFSEIDDKTMRGFLPIFMMKSRATNPTRICLRPSSRIAVWRHAGTTPPQSAWCRLSAWR